MQQLPNIVQAPNILIIESAGSLRLAPYQVGVQWHSVARTPYYTAGNSSALAETLRTRGYYTAHVACHLLRKEDNLPIIARGFDKVYNVFFYTDSGDTPAETGADFRSCARRVHELNDDVISRALRWIADSAACGQPFYVMCAVETAAGRAGYDHQIQRLRLALRELGIEQDTLLVHHAGVAGQMVPKAA